MRSALLLCLALTGCRDTPRVVVVGGGLAGMAAALEASGAEGVEVVLLEGGEQLGHGKDYLYPHDFPDHIVRQQYLPDALVGERFFEPTQQGAEKQIRDRMAWVAQRLGEEE